MRSKAITTPALVITLGTSSSLAALEICRHLLSLSPDDRRAVAFLGIDTDKTQPHLQALLDEHVGAFQAFMAQIEVPAAIDESDRPPHEEHTFIPSKKPEYYEYGAGGIRNHGHVALCYHCSTVQQRLEESVGALESLGLAEGERFPAGIQIHVVAFLGGGTGSGIVADIAVMARNLMVQRQTKHRLILHAILPGDNIAGATQTELSWRKSNATSAMLEIMAHNLAAGAAHSVARTDVEHYNMGFGGQPVRRGKVYRKFLLESEFDVPNSPIFNEIFLLSRTAVNSVEGTARIVGLDVFQRITDASGVGDRVRSKAPDHQELLAADNRGLTTNFSVSCPFEVRFPADETAVAFAEYMAARMLENERFIGKRPDPFTPAPIDKQEWTGKWKKVAALGTGAAHGGEATLSINPPNHFNASEFDPPSRARCDAKLQEALNIVGTMSMQIDLVLKRVREDEERRIAAIPPTTSKEGERFTSRSPFGRKINYLESLVAEYKHVLSVLNSMQLAPPGQQKFQKVKDRAIGAFPIPLPLVEDYLAQRNTQALAQALNELVIGEYRTMRHERLTKLVESLRSAAQDQLDATLQFLEKAETKQAASDLRRQSAGRVAWQGKLALPHQHQRHLFDLQSLQKKFEENQLDVLPAVEGVFRWATSQLGDLALGDCTDRGKFDLRPIIESHIGPCTDYVNSARHGGEAIDDGSQTSRPDDVEAEDARAIPQKVVDYFREFYLDWFERWNLFDILEVGIAAETTSSIEAARRQTGTYLLQHMLHMKGILRDLIVYEPEIWLGGRAQVKSTLYLGINLREDTSQQEILHQVLNAVAPFTRHKSLPDDLERNELDPHRLQVNYARHGISIRTIPEFFHRQNSAMADYLGHQARWCGNWVSRRRGGTYGLSQMPVHSSGEMERLVCHPTALDNHWHVNLAERVIRDTYEGPDAPDWASNDGGDGYQPQGGGVRDGGYPRDARDPRVRDDDPYDPRYDAPSSDPYGHLGYGNQPNGEPRRGPRYDPQSRDDNNRL